MLRAKTSASILLFLALPLIAGNGSKAKDSLLKCWEVMEALVRDPAHGAPDPVYLENQRNAQRHFVQWYQKERLLKFRDMLREAHRLALKNPNYSTPDDLPLTDPKRTRPGRIRADQWFIDLIPETIPKFIDKTLAEKEPSYAPKQGSGWDGYYTWTPEITGVPAEARPSMDYHGSTPNHPYHRLLYFMPNAKYLKHYFKRMQTLMTETKQLPSDKLSSNDRTKLCGLLAEYLQLGVIAHPFDGQNSSILMGQVNAILGLHGLQPISHGYLDMIGMTVGTERFKRIFTAQVEQAQTRAKK